MEKNANIENALRIVASKISGKNLAYTIDEQNKIAKIVCLADGVFVASDKRIQKFNALSQNIILNTIFPYSVVKKNQVIGQLEVVNIDITMEDVDAIIFALSGNFELLNINLKEKKSVAFIYSTFFNDKSEKEHLARMVKKLVSNLSFLELSFEQEFYAAHSFEDIDNAIYLAQKSNCDVIFVLPSILDKKLIESAIKESCDELICNYFAEIGVSDIIIGAQKSTIIIGVPYNYANQDSYNIDFLINKAILTETLIPKDFLPVSPAVLNSDEIISKEQEASLTSPLSNKNSFNKGNVAGVILAAGISARAGINKLLIEAKDGKPAFLKPIEAAIKANISPIFVVLGYRSEEMEEFLSGVDVNVLINSDYRSGIKSSISLGLKSIPSFCKGAVLIPADQPYLTAEHLEKMLKAFDIKKERQVVVSTFDNVKHNPIMWSKALFEYADLVPENSINRSFFVSHMDYMKEVDAPTPEILKDITYPSDVEKFEKKN